MGDAAGPGAPELREICRAEDPARIEDLLRRVGVFSAEEIAIGRELVEERLQRGAASGYEFRFADRGSDIGGSLGGYCCFGPIPLTQGAWDLYWIAVDPAARGQGIGRALIDALHEAAANEGCRAIYIDTSSRPDYAPAHRLYAAAGYRVAARLTDFYAPGDDKLIFTRAIYIAAG
ncbi:MAG: GNAT family N-acetyltransferase [Rhodospirillaceae bacterium]|nr:GNAT family N-acetyltransferase [Rhodospirillaceae bacterium]